VAGGEGMKSIKDMIKELPPDLQREVADFAQFLIERRVRKAGKKLSQDWAGLICGAEIRFQ